MMWHTIASLPKVYVMEKKSWDIYFFQQLERFNIYYLSVAENQNLLEK